MMSSERDGKDTKYDPLMWELKEKNPGYQMKQLEIHVHKQVKHSC